MSTIVLLAMVLSGGEPDVRQVDIKSHLGKFEGCFVIKELGGNWSFRYNQAGCERRFSPPCTAASTCRICR